MPSYMIEGERAFVQPIGLIRSMLMIKYMNGLVMNCLVIQVYPSHSWYNLSLAVSLLVSRILLKFYNL